VTSLKPAELKMAQQQISEMTSEWKPQDYKDDFTSAVRALIQKKAKAGDKATVEPFEEAPDLSESNVVDLSDLLRQSLGSKAKARKTAKTLAPKKSVAPAAKKAAGRASKTKKAA
jgi:DNA end-binding protein Ku